LHQTIEELNLQQIIDTFTRASEPNPDVAQFRRISIPLVRRVYPSLVANNIVGVQPLAGPTLRFRYSENRGSRRSIPENKSVNWKEEGF
jgi:hypothetical protein